MYFLQFTSINLNFHDALIQSVSIYLFVIMNTDRSDKKGTHYWSFLDLYPKKEISFFDSFGLEGFKEFIVNDDKRTINNIFYDFRKFNVPDKKITLVTAKYLKK